MNNFREDPRIMPLSISGHVECDETPCSVHIDNISLGGAKISYRSNEGFKKCGELHIQLDGYGEIHTAFEFLEVAKNTARLQFDKMSFKERLLLQYFIDNYSLMENNKK